MEQVNELKQTLRLPTIGRQVHYFPINDPHCAANGATVLPATVVQVHGKYLNLSIITMNADGPLVMRWSVPHASDAGSFPGAMGVWEWPAYAPDQYIEI